ncbi:MAG: hypothetical protein R3191_05675 [Anaerolineales bacterium]|nr:hypothetical protein [Anaerolineales bacterium]
MKWLGYVLAGLMLLTGVVWVLQGIGLLPGSFMTGQPEWAVAGVISIVVGGLVLRLTTQKAGGNSSTGEQSGSAERGSER